MHRPPPLTSFCFLGITIRCILSSSVVWRSAYAKLSGGIRFDLRRMGVVARLERVDERDCLFYLQIVPWYVVLNVQTNGNKVLLGSAGQTFY